MNKKKINWIRILSLMCFYMVLIGVPLFAFSPMIIESPIGEINYYSYKGEISDVYYFDGTFGAGSKTIVQLENGKTLEFIGDPLYNIRKCQNATLNYSQNRFKVLFFNNITIGNKTIKGSGRIWKWM